MPRFITKIWNKSTPAELIGMFCGLVTIILFFGSVANAVGDVGKLNLWKESTEVRFEHMATQIDDMYRLLCGGGVCKGR